MTTERHHQRLITRPNGSKSKSLSTQELPLPHPQSTQLPPRIRLVLDSCTMAIPVMKWVVPLRERPRKKRRTRRAPRPPLKAPLRGHTGHRCLLRRPPCHHRQAWPTTLIMQGLPIRHSTRTITTILSQLLQVARSMRSCHPLMPTPFNTNTTTSRLLPLWIQSMPTAEKPPPRQLLQQQRNT